MGCTAADGLRGRPVDVLQAAPRGSRAAVRHRHPRDAALPTAARAGGRADRRGAHADRRAGLLVSARHRRDQLSPRARQELGRGRGDRPRGRAAALLPRRPGCTSSPARTTAGCSASDASFSRGRPASLHRARALRRRRRACTAPSCARPRARSLRRHLARRPASNPFARFAAQLERDLPRLLEGDASDYHAYAFATVRMAGSAFEAAASPGRVAARETAPSAASQALARIVEGCKALSFRLARRRAVRARGGAGRAGAAWDEAMEQLDAALA